MNKLSFLKFGIALAIAALLIALFIIVLRIFQYSVPLWYYYVFMLFSLISAGLALFSIFLSTKKNSPMDNKILDARQVNQMNRVIREIMILKDMQQENAMQASTAPRNQPTKGELDIEEKSLELAERHLNLEKERANYALEIVHELTHTLSSETDPQTREKLLDAFIEQFIRSQQRETWLLSSPEKQENREAIPEE